MNPYISWEANTLNTKQYQRLSNDFDHSLSIQPKITSQGSSGRCWIFAALNVLRIPYIKANKLPMDFEFSQNYLFFWDKYSRCEYFLNIYPKIKKSNNARLIDFILNRPVVDGGQWNMFVNLVEKYGIIPKTDYSDTYNSKDSKRLNGILNGILKKAIILGINTTEVLLEVKNILIQFIGEPPNEIVHKMDGKKIKMTPLEFYSKIVKPIIGCNVSDYISIINDPRNEYHIPLTVNYLNNMVNGQDIIYLNKPMDTLIDITKHSIQNDLPVWFGSDVMQYTSRELCIGGLEYFKYPMRFGELTKYERLLTRDSCMTHAMVIHGYSDSESNFGVEKWKVENSWGKHGPYEGYYIFDNKWFENFVYQITVHRDIAIKFVPDYKTEIKKTARRLPPWDAFGSLARYKRPDYKCRSYRSRRVSLQLMKCFA